MKIKDLDILIPEKKGVKLDGDVYEIPVDMPVEIALRLQKAAQQSEEAGGGTFATEVLIEVVLDLLSYKREIDREAVRKQLTMTHINAIMAHVVQVGEA